MCAVNAAVASFCVLSKELWKVNFQTGMVLDVLVCCYPTFPLLIPYVRYFQASRLCSNYIPYTMLLIWKTWSFATKGRGEALRMNVSPFKSTSLISFLMQSQRKKGPIGRFLSADSGHYMISPIGEAQFFSRVIFNRIYIFILIHVLGHICYADRFQFYVRIFVHPLFRIHSYEDMGENRLSFRSWKENPLKGLIFVARPLKFLLQFRQD